MNADFWKSLFDDLPDISGILLAAIGAAIMFAPEALKRWEARHTTRYVIAAFCVIVGVAGLASGHMQRADNEANQRDLRTQVNNLTKEMEGVRSSQQLTNEGIGEIRKGINQPALSNNKTPLAPRARVYITGLTAVPVEASQPLKVQVHFKNNGRVTAHIKAWYVIAAMPVVTDAAEESSNEISKRNEVIENQLHRSALMKRILLAICLCLLCASCGQRAVVHASAPSAIALDCSQAQPVGQNDDGQGTLTINWGPCTVNASGAEPVGANASLSYTLQHAIDARVLDAWIGTLAGSKIEVGYYMQITTPDGRKALFVNQYDKHQDVIGNSPPHQWNIPLNLPAGTQIEIGLAVGITHPDTDCPCGIHAQWFFNHGFD